MWETGYGRSHVGLGVGKLNLERWLRNILIVNNWKEVREEGGGEREG